MNDEKHDDVLELSDAYKVSESDSNGLNGAVADAEMEGASVTPLTVPEQDADDAFELREDHVVNEGADIPDGSTEAPVEHAFDFGTPGMVFDEDIPEGEPNAFDGSSTNYDVEIDSSEDVNDDVFEEDGVPLPQNASLDTGPHGQLGADAMNAAVAAGAEANSAMDTLDSSVSARVSSDHVVASVFGNDDEEQTSAIPLTSPSSEPSMVSSIPGSSRVPVVEVSSEQDDMLEDRTGEIEEVTEETGDGEVEEMEAIEMEELVAAPVPQAPPMPPPQTPPSTPVIRAEEDSEFNDSGRPIGSFFKNDKFAAAQASLKLRAKTENSKQKGQWWERIFDDDYLMLLPNVTERELAKETAFIKSSLGLPSGALLLDLACGDGVNAISMAKQNYRMVGVDLSLSMLSRAGELAQDSGVKINFIHGDMRDLGFDKTFDGVFCMNTSFGFFDDNTNLKVLKGVYQALKPGGSFLLELANRDFVIKQQPNMVWFQLDNMVCMEETDFNYINNRLYISRQIIVGDNERQNKHDFSLRMYSLNEIGKLLHQAGFAVAKVSGHRSTPGAFFGPESAKLIIVAKRR